MRSTEFNQKCRELNKSYIKLFGYIPSPSDYACTNDQFAEALSKAVEDKKEISNYLSKRAMHIADTLE